MCTNHVDIAGSGRGLPNEVNSEWNNCSVSEKTCYTVCAPERVVTACDGGRETVCMKAAAAGRRCQWEAVYPIGKVLAASSLLSSALQV